MKSFLEKISWLTRRWNFKFRLFDLYLHDEHNAWGFEFFTIQYNYTVYSALALLVRLPNKTTTQEFVIDDWDFLFLERPLWNWWAELDDRNLWNGNLNRFEKFALRILNKIVK